MKSALTLLLISSAVFGLAQENKLPTGILTGKASLATRTDVASDIDLNISQAQAIQDKMRGLGNIPLNGATGVIPALEQLDQEVQTLLTKEQWARLTQLWIQYEGPFVLLSSAVANSLKVSPDNRTKIAKLAEEYGGWWRSQISSVRKAGDLEKIQRQARKVGGKILSLLTPEQKQQFEEMKGPKFRFQN
jgi:hypothetical protein